MGVRCSAPAPVMSATPPDEPDDGGPRIVRAPLEDEQIASALGVAVPPEEFAATVLKARILFKRRLDAARVAKRPEYAGSGSAVATTKSAGLRRAVSADEVGGREHDISAGLKLLRERLAFCELKEARMGDDGNCQFRALSYQLFGTQEHHAYVRERACAQLLKARDDFEIFFEAGEFEPWVRSMQESKKWGDELTLRAAADTFRCIIHVITSTPGTGGWHLVYTPGAGVPVRRLFVTYISPIHYNSIERNFNG